MTGGATVMITTGGTGGHVFPGLAVYSALTGDTEAADRVELALPRTGVCKLDSRSRDDSCDAPVPGPVAAGTAA